MRPRAPRFFFSTLLKYSEKKGISCNPQLFFSVIYDVKKYKEFLPWCEDSIILRNNNKTDFDAELTINFRLFTESYISRVTLKETATAYTIVSDSSNTNIFEKLRSTWEIQKQVPTRSSNICDYKYDIEFQFKNFLYQQAASFFLNTITKNMSACFEKRALELSSQTLSRGKPPIINDEENANTQLRNLGINEGEKADRAFPNENEERPKQRLSGTDPNNDSAILNIFSEFYNEKKITKLELDTLNNIFTHNKPSKNTILNLFRVHGNNFSDKEIRIKTAFLLRELLSNMGQ